ncbi:hypothetical protein BDF20DRAFT_916063 [Mycotypha africana]|uniref:uncharacterized protein n=1 Tax=Mycotypha africana TaxID=64632 RepID=UPI0023009728|nr:uncharacterized protein BDF20DRAFT_916063 [Mycotypha africana]KAI8970221.1 hypothetical protein BDF20DRAFT_916063 [Mycotypha africana]
MLTVTKCCRMFLAASLAASVSAYNVIENCKPGFVALTYDDGPNVYTSDLINYLNQNNVKATFFVNGDNFLDIESNYEAKNALRSAYESGHQIASHTWSHQDLTTLSKTKFDEEVFKLENAIQAVIHEKPAFLRPPYGSIDYDTVEKLESENYSVVLWSTDTKDYDTHDIESEMANIEESVSSLDEGYIVLAHDVFEQTTGELTREMVRYFKGRGFKFATVAECVGKSAYK